MDQFINNTATVDQSGSNNVADINQVLPFVGSGNTASVVQSGTFNTATVTQDAGNSASVDQSGNNNTATVQQFDVPGFFGSANDNNASVTQSGDWNQATITQDDNNSATVVDQSGMGTMADPNVIIIDQIENNDIAMASQAGFEGNFIQITQDGFGTSIANESQNGSFNTTIVNQFN